MTFKNRWPRPSFAFQFLIALVIAAPLYAQQILAAWSDRTESQLVALFLVDDESQADPAQLLAAIKQNVPICEGRVVEPGEVESWIAAAVGQTAAGDGSTTPVAAVPAALELAFRGSVTRPEEFHKTLSTVREHPACARLFFDEATHKKVAQFYGRARGVLRFGLLLGLVGAFAAIAGAGRTQSEREPASHTLGPANRWASALGRALGPSLAAWFCLFAILWLWPIPPPDGLSLAGHGFVLAATAVVVELLTRSAAAARWYFA